MRLLFSATLVAALLAVPACATPIISGKYILTGRVFCQPTLNVNYVTPNKIGNITLGRNTFQTELMLIDFFPKTGAANYGVTYEAGDNMLIQNTGASQGLFGMSLVETQAGGNLNYMVTDTTITLGQITYNALFGSIDDKNRAHYFAYQTTYTVQEGVQCTEQGEAQRQ